MNTAKETDWLTCTLLMAKELNMKPNKATLELLSIQKGGKS